MALSKVTYVDGVTIIGAKNLNDIQDELIRQGEQQAEDEAELALKANAADVQTALALKADKSDTYTKSEVDTALNGKADKSTTYTKTEVDSALALKANKADTYDRYKKEKIDGLSLDMFDICPTQYSITQYDDTDALQHGTLSGSGLTYLISKLKAEFSDIKFKWHYISNSSIFFSIASTSAKSISIALNLTSGNVSLRTPTSSSSLSGIIRNQNCRTIVADDELHFIKNGTKVALYLVDNGTDVPVFEDEWIDVLEAYPNEGFQASDIGFGLTTTNSARNEILIYDFSFETETGDHFMPFDEVVARFDSLGAVSPKTVDLFLFMGQSNMAGRGNSSQAPNIINGAGYEFRAISDPTKLYPANEPFGLDENVSGAIYDYLGGYKAKTGGMVVPFINAYYTYAKCPIVGVSASEGGTQIAYWLPNTARYNDAVSRYDDAVTWLINNGYTIRHKYILWCQGETNGDLGTSKADYISAFTTMANAWFANGIEKIFIVKIGNYNGEDGYDYNTIMTAQNEICQTMANVVMVSTDFAGMKERDLMKDAFHYYQDAYNEVGEYSGINTAFYVKTGKEPTMYDTQNGTLYYTHKN